LRGFGFDLPAAKPIFEEFVAKNGLSDRVEFQAGDFFTGPLPAADVLIMGHIIHDWDLPQKKALLSKAYQALPKGGALIVYDAVIDDERRENAFGLLMSLNMLIETPAGSTTRGPSAMREAGFSETRVEPLTGPDSMVIGIKWAPVLGSASSADAQDARRASVSNGRRKTATGFRRSHMQAPIALREICLRQRRRSGARR
jgi:hypothetical protein